MAAGSDSYHEPYDRLSDSTTDLHRALVTLIEELEAIDWYRQRAEVCKDDELREVLRHNQDEEMEHAMMALEWIRRRVPAFGEKVDRYLGVSGSIVAAEPSEEERNGADTAPRDGSLGIGGLRARKGGSS